MIVLELGFNFWYNALMAFGEIPDSFESTHRSPQSVVESLMPQFEAVETETQAIDAVLELKMQCVEQGVDFGEAQTVITAGLADTAKNVGMGLIRGILTNPQAGTAIGQLLS